MYSYDSKIITLSDMFFFCSHSLLQHSFFYMISYRGWLGLQSSIPWHPRMRHKGLDNHQIGLRVDFL